MTPQLRQDAVLLHFLVEPSQKAVKTFFLTGIYFCQLVSSPFYSRIEYGHQLKPLYFNFTQTRCQEGEEGAATLTSPCPLQLETFLTPEIDLAGEGVLKKRGGKAPSLNISPPLQITIKGLVALSNLERGIQGVRLAVIINRRELQTSPQFTGMAAYDIIWRVIKNMLEKN